MNAVINFSASIPGLVLWCLLSPLSCPLKPQLVEADGRPSWFWFCQKIFLLKGSFSFHSRLCMLRVGDWIEEKFGCNHLGFLSEATFLKIGSVCMN